MKFNNVNQHELNMGKKTMGEWSWVLMQGFSAINMNCTGESDLVALHSTLTHLIYCKLHVNYCSLCVVVQVDWVSLSLSRERALVKLFRIAHTKLSCFGIIVDCGSKKIFAVVGSLRCFASCTKKAPCKINK